MERVSLLKALNRRRKVGLVITTLLLVPSLIVLSFFALKNPKEAKAVGPYTISQSGFIWNNGTTIKFCTTAGAGTAATQYVYYNDGSVPTPTCTTWSIDLTNIDLIIDGSSTVVVEWGFLRLNSLVIKNGATLTHAPLVYHTSKTSYVHYQNPYPTNAIWQNIHDVNNYRDIGEQDFDIATGAWPTNATARAFAQKKQIDLRITGDLTLTGGGKIDVTGKGYPGGRGAGNGSYGGYYYYDQWGINENTTGRGLPTSNGGLYARTNNNGVFVGGSGGGGYGTGVTGGKGRSYSSAYSSLNGGPAYTGTTLTYGFGGGSAGNGADTTSGVAKPGGAGGGMISIQANNLYFSRNSAIRADGSKGNNYGWGGGGGGGGTISISITGAVHLQSQTTDPSTSGGDWNETTENGNDLGEAGNNGTLYHPGESGTDGLTPVITPATSVHLGNITSRGGNGGNSIADNIGTNYMTCSGAKACAAGGGGGGKITINVTGGGSSPYASDLCWITSDSSPSDRIPQTCNRDSDVTIDGTTVNADVITVWQTPSGGDSLPGGAVVGGNCTDSSNRYCDSKRYFKSLKVINGGNLTHSDLAVTYDANLQDITGGDIPSEAARKTSLAGAISGTGRWKKVDISVEEDITLDSGGKIDVSGKGYPGGLVGGSGYAYPIHDGAGPGGGPRDSHNCDGCVNAGGGAWGGNGGLSSPGNYFAQRFPSTYTPSFTPSNFEFGSGGGSAYNPREGYHAHAPGGDGGGRIYLSATNINIRNSSSVIKAKGAPGVYGQEAYGHATGGAGSGGTIWIQSSSVSYPSTTGMTLSTVAAGLADAFSMNIMGTVGSFDAIDYPGGYPFYNIDASGGDSGGFGVSGGGGRVIIQKSSSPSISKLLKAVYRAGAGDDPDNPLGTNDLFNPYALQMGDIIQVDLIAKNISSSFSLTDEILKVPPSGAKCMYMTSSGGVNYLPSPTPTSTVSNLVVWSSLTDGDGDGSAEAYYYCRVQNP